MTSFGMESALRVTVGSPKRTAAHQGAARRSSDRSPREARLAIVGSGSWAARWPGWRGRAASPPHQPASGAIASAWRPGLKDGTLDAVTTALAEGGRNADLIVLAATVSPRQPPRAGVAGGAAGRRRHRRRLHQSRHRGGRRASRRSAARALRGRHPMAGSERSGYAIARADLFDAPQYRDPHGERDPDAVKSFVGFWEANRRARRQHGSRHA